MNTTYTFLCGIALAILSLAAMAQDNYSGAADDLPFAGNRPSSQSSFKYSYDFGSGQPTFNVDNKKNYEATGNLSIDNDQQQEFERCQRVRAQMRGKDVAKLNC